jgi:hypothetical protein
MAAHERKATNAILAQLEVEVKELARARGIDVVTEVNAVGKDLLYRHWSRYPIRGPALTDELIRLHDERFPVARAEASEAEPTLPPWAQKCSAELMAAASGSQAFAKGKLVHRYGVVTELRVDLSDTRQLAAMFTVKRSGPPRKIVSEWFSPPRSDEPGFMLVKAVDGREVTMAGSDAQDPLREDFEKTFKPILESCLQY